jgi:hypothetical protein
MDPDPAIVVIDLHDANKKLIFFAYFFWNVHLHHFSKIKRSKRSQKRVGIKVLLTIFA